MALFAKSKRGVDQVEQAERALADARAARAKLADRHSAAEATVATKQAAAEQAALAGADDATLDRAEVEMRAATDREQTLRSAMAKAEQQIAEAERALADAVERRDRDLVASHLEKLGASIANLYPEYNDAGFQLAQVLNEAQEAIGEAAGLAQFLQNARNEIAQACYLLDQELRTRAAAVRAGTMSYKIHRQQVPSLRKSAEPAKESSSETTAA